VTCCAEPLTGTWAAWEGSTRRWIIWLASGVRVVRRDHG
jgi:hypothetical protein